MTRFHLVTSETLDPNNPLLLQVKDRFSLASRPSRADAILVLGGDGTMLGAIRRYRHLGIPFYGLNFGHIGFLMNKANEETLDEILAHSVQEISMKSLEARLYDASNSHIKDELAFNDFYFERTSAQTANIAVSVNGIQRFDPYLICDGVIVATAAGSTAYTVNASGVVLPIGTNSMVLTGICPSIIHNWKSSQLAGDSHITLEALGTKKRPVRFLVDGVEIPKVAKVEITYSEEEATIVFINSNIFQEKVLALQFSQ